jgi:hypothetical protein
MSGKSLTQIKTMLLRFVNWDMDHCVVMKWAEREAIVHLRGKGGFVV